MINVIDIWICWMHNTKHKWCVYILKYICNAIFMRLLPLPVPTCADGRGACVHVTLIWLCAFEWFSSTQIHYVYYDGFLHHFFLSEMQHIYGATHMQISAADIFIAGGQSAMHKNLFFPVFNYSNAKFAFYFQLKLCYVCACALHANHISIFLFLSWIISS